MQRTQISLTVADRRVLDAAAARTGRSISSLIREAVNVVYGADRSVDDDLATMREAFGSWRADGVSGGVWVDGLRSGRRVEGAPAGDDGSRDTTPVDASGSVETAG